MSSDKPSKTHSNIDVTVLIAVYNGEQSLNDTLNSVFNQSWKNIYVVAVNDASTDNSLAILKKWQLKFTPNRFIIINNQHNIGLTRSLNIGLAKCKSKYIARIDADDTWSPNKLELQIKFLENNPATGVVGSWYTNITRSSYSWVGALLIQKARGGRLGLVSARWRSQATEWQARLFAGNNRRCLLGGKCASPNRSFKLPTTNTAIKRNIFRINPFGHSCVVIRKKLLDQVGGYNSDITYSQDRDLWFRLMDKTDFNNLPFYLCQRQNSHNLSTLKSRQQMWQSFKIRLRYTYKLHAPLYNYIFLFLPLAIILKSLLLPPKIKQSQPSFPLNRYSTTNEAKHNLLFINDRPLIPHRAETIARQAMAKAFTKHPSIDKVSVKNISPLQSLYIKLPQKYLFLYLRCGSLASAIITCRLFFTPQILIIEVHNLNHATINLLASLLYRFTTHRADLFITIDPISTVTWINYGAPSANVYELPSAANSPKHLSPAKKATIIQKYSLPANKKLIVYCGSLYRHRGIEDIIEAASLLTEKPYHFVLAGGSTEDIQYYKSYIRTGFNDLNNISFLKHIPHPQVMSLLTTADLILITYSKRCPTVTTMSPLKLVEALSVGTKILATDLPRIRAISKKHAISYYSADDAQSLTQNILNVFSQKTDKTPLEKSFKFTWEDRTNKILKKIL